MSMTIQDYQRLMQALASELTLARTMGREERVRAMEVAVQRLTEYMERMYEEGRALHDRCEQLEASVQVEATKAKEWYTQQLSELKRQGDEWITNYKSELDKRFEGERAEMAKKLQEEKQIEKNN